MIGVDKDGGWPNDSAWAVAMEARARDEVARTTSADAANVIVSAAELDGVTTDELIGRTEGHMVTTDDDGNVIDLGVIGPEGQGE